MNRPLRAAAAASLILAACTRGTATTPIVTSASEPQLPARVTVEGRRFDVSCTPVAEALVDIKLPHDAGEPMVRAITGLWDHQAVAVLANDRTGCGVWALGVAQGVSDQAVEAIRAEIADGVTHFGVTASPVPRDEGNG
jgi:hypothetical protein